MARMWSLSSFRWFLVISWKMNTPVDFNHTLIPPHGRRCSEEGFSKPWVLNHGLLLYSVYRILSPYKIVSTILITMIMYYEGGISFSVWGELLKRYSSNLCQFYFSLFENNMWGFLNFYFLNNKTRNFGNLLRCNLHRALTNDLAFIWTQFSWELWMKRIWIPISFCQQGWKKVVISLICSCGNHHSALASSSIL